MAVPLAAVVKRGRLRDVFQLEGVATGSIDLELEWFSG